MSDLRHRLGRIYTDISVPFMLLSTWVGFSMGVIGELECKNTAITSFVNIVGTSFIGFTSGALWPIAMPLLSMGAVYNKYKGGREAIN